MRTCELPGVRAGFISLYVKKALKLAMERINESINLHKSHDKTNQLSEMYNIRSNRAILQHDWSLLILFQ